eukprot:COSAG01_NODE_156_length_23748_cov_439.062371_2_plen_48_part_00
MSPSRVVTDVRSGNFGPYAFQKLHQKNYGSDDFGAHRELVARSADFC